jgi:deazaflavin-dependent oxidoreductase (nitroreductase family)
VLRPSQDYSALGNQTAPTEAGQPGRSPRPAVGGAPEETLASLVARDSRRLAFGDALGRLVGLPLVGRYITHAMRLPNRVRFLSTRVTRLHAWLLGRARGRVRRSWLFAAGQPVLSLTTIGRRSGEPRTTAVACFVDGEHLVLAGMNLGLERNPAWALNLEATPSATIEVAGETVGVMARRATGEEAVRLWRRWVELQPSAEAVRRIASREIPLFVLARRDSPAL